MRAAATLRPEQVHQSECLACGALSQRNGVGSLNPTCKQKQMFDLKFGLRGACEIRFKRRAEALTQLDGCHLLPSFIAVLDSNAFQQLPMDSKDGRLLETYDDWCCSTFWYEPLPSRRLPPFPSWESRTANLWTESQIRAA